MTGLPDDLASILQIWCIRCQYGHFVNQGIGGNHSVKRVPMDRGEFSGLVDDSAFQIQNRDVLDTGLFFDPVFRHSGKGQLATVVFQYNLPYGSEAQKSLFMVIIKCGFCDGSELPGIAGKPDEGAGIEKYPHAIPQSFNSSALMGMNASGEILNGSDVGSPTRGRLRVAVAAGTRRATGCLPRHTMISSPSSILWSRRERCVFAS